MKKYSEIVCMRPECLCFYCVLLCLEICLKNCYWNVIFNWIYKVDIIIYGFHYRLHFQRMLHLTGFQDLLGFFKIKVKACKSLNYNTLKGKIYSIPDHSLFLKIQIKLLHFILYFYFIVFTFSHMCIHCLSHLSNTLLYPILLKHKHRR
jgi:hypothetical protein